MASVPTRKTHVTVPLWLLVISAAIPITLVVGLLTGRVLLHGRKTRR